MVLGAGPIGLGVIQVLKARGAKQIIIAEVAQERKSFATHFGATHILDPRNDDVVAKCKELTGGRGVSIALDCAGVPASIKTACLATRAQGSIVNVAIWEKEVPFNPMNLVFGEKHYSAGKSARSKLGQGLTRNSSWISGQGLSGSHRLVGRWQHKAREDDNREDRN